LFCLLLWLKCVFFGWFLTIYPEIRILEVSYDKVKVLATKMLSKNIAGEREQKWEEKEKCTEFRLSFSYLTIKSDQDWCPKREDGEDAYGMIRRTNEMLAFLTVILFYTNLKGYTFGIRHVGS